MFSYALLGWVEISIGRPGRRGGLRDEERLRVYGHRYFAVPSQVLLLCNLQRSLNALGLHRHAETSSAASYLDHDLHHFAPLCAQTAPPLLVPANALVTFGVLNASGAGSPAGCPCPERAQLCGWARRPTPPSK